MTLLEDIRGISREAARKLESVDCCTDSDIRTLTHYDLHELLPGFSNFKERKRIYEAIHKKRPIHAVLDELKSFVPDEFLRDALRSNGALHEYLQMLKTLKAEMNHVQEFLDAHIALLEKYGQNQDSNSNKDRASVPSVNHAPAASLGRPSSASNTNYVERMDHSHSQKDLDITHMEHHFSPKAQASSFSPRYGLCNFEAHRRPQLKANVTYKMVVSGNTLDRHLDMMGKLKNDVRDSLNLQESQHEEHSQVIIVFCPVVSRAGTDVETALQNVSSGAKPVILVMMHHSRNAQTSPIVKPQCYHNVVLVVNVFFHETVPGLLKCPQNDEAMLSVQTKLQLFST